MNDHPQVAAPTGFPTTVRVHPGPLAGVLRVPGDKSLSHRALLLGALCDDPVTVDGLADAGDIRSTARALGTMGVEVTLRPAGDGTMGATVGAGLREPDDVVDCGNAGTGMRLLAGIAAGVEGMTVLTGDGSLRRRPMQRVVQPLAAMGVRVEARGGGRLPPLVVHGGTPHATHYRSAVASAQVKSLVLLAGLRAAAPTTVSSPLVSRDHTERMLRWLGVDVAARVDDDGGEHVTVVPSPLRARDLHVPGDPSSAAFWLVAGAIGSPGREVVVRDVCVNPTRTGVVTALRAMGADVRVGEVAERSGEPTADLRVVPDELVATELSGRTVVDALDELPVLAVAGAVGGGLRVRDAGELRVKESDRIAATADVFARIGLRITEHRDGFDVPGGQVPAGGSVHARGDHRIAMSSAVAATVGTAPITIAGCGSVATSYPGFFDDLARLGGRVEVVARS